MLQLQLAPQRPAVWRLPLAALAVNQRLPVHYGEHALQRTLGLGDVWEAQLQAAAAAGTAAAGVHWGLYVTV
jgi:hypothetical protein